PFSIQSFTIADTTPPDLVCFPTLRAADVGTDRLFDMPATELCSSGTNVTITVVTNLVTGISDVTNTFTNICSSLFSVTRTWRATDACSNSATCNQTITVVANGPSVTSAPSQVVECGTAF